MTDRELMERVWNELVALRGSNLDLHKHTNSELSAIKVGMGKLEERVGSVINDRLRKHSDNHRELSVAIGAVKAEAMERADELERKIDTLATEASETRGGRRVWLIGIAAAASVVGSIVGGVVTAVLIKKLGG